MGLNERAGDGQPETGAAHRPTPTECAKDVGMAALGNAGSVILDRELDKRNFRRRMLSLGIIKPTGGTRMEGAHRPAQLFTFTRREPVTV